MTRRLFLCLLALMMLPLWVLAEDASEAPSLRTASSIEEAAQFVLYPSGDGPSSVEAGYIRYIAQRKVSDEHFRPDYWIGDEPGGLLDLTLSENKYGHEYTFHVGNMCTRAAYSMALSYLGIDMTPGQMSALTGERQMNPPYDEISALVSVERAEYKSHVFNTMMENYLSDPSYSPVYLYLRRPNGVDHAVLVIAALPETSRFVVVDPSMTMLNNEPVRVYMMALNKTRQEIVNSTFRYDFMGSKVLALYQWRLVEQADGAEK